jgi:hypothetical protein
MDSSWVFGTSIVLASIVVAVGGVALMRRAFSQDRLRRHNEIAGPIHATIGVIYAVILAFVVIAVWEQFNDASESVIFESGQLIAMNHDLQALPIGEARVVQAALESYTRAVIEREWPALQSDHYVVRTTPEYRELWSVLRRVEAEDRQGRVWLETMIDRINSIDEWRSQRFLAVESSVPTPLWILLISGGLVTILFAALFGAEHGPTQMIMVSALAALIAFTLFLITAIDHPFSGAVRVDPEAFRHALEQIEETDLRESLNEVELPPEQGDRGQIDSLRSLPK